MSDFLNEIKKRLKDTGEDIVEAIEEAEEELKDEHGLINVDTQISQWADGDIVTLGIGTNSFSNVTFTSGSLLTTTGAGTVSITSPPVSSGPITMSGDLHVEGDITFGDEKSFNKRLDAIEEKLLILQNNVEKHEQYPALKDLYDQYKMIEALISGPKTNECSKDEDEKV